MIKKILVVLPVIAALFFTSCKDEEVLKVFSISPQDITFSYKGDSSYISVYGDQENWEMWIGKQDPAETQCSFDKAGTVFSKSGKGRTEAMLIYSKPNDTRVKHVDTLYLRDKSGKYSDIKVSLTISSVGIKFDVADSIMYVPVDGTIKFDVESNVDQYEVLETPAGSTYERTEDGFAFEFGKNGRFVRNLTVKMVGRWTDRDKSKELNLTFIQDADQDGMSGIKWDSTQLASIKNDLSIGWDLSKPVSTWAGVEVGKITSSEGVVERVTDVNLQNKDLTGALPVKFSLMPYLRVLRLDGNHFTGNLVPDYRLLRYLNTFSVDGNELTGAITGTMFDFWSDMKLFIISNNRFTGSIPKEIATMKILTNLQLSGNDFTGSLPAEIGGLRRMMIFTVSGNQLTGVVPMSYQNNDNWLRWNPATNIQPQQGGGSLTLK